MPSPMNEQAKVIKGYCLRALSLRDCFTAQLRQKIAKKYPEVDQEIVDSVLTELTASKLLDDTRAIAILVRKLKSTGKGFYYFQSKLKSLAVGQEILRNASDYYSVEEEKEIAQQLINKFNKLSQLDKSSKIKIFRLLQSRGFRSSAFGHLFDYQSSF